MWKTPNLWKATILAVFLVQGLFTLLGGVENRTVIWIGCSDLFSFHFWILEPVKHQLKLVWPKIYGIFRTYPWTLSEDD